MRHYTGKMDIGKQALRRHRQLKGKISIGLKDKLDNQKKLSLYYTPGVAAVSSYTAKHPEQTRDYTWLNNSVAVISDGSAVLGLGNIGPYGALPVMEGKSALFKQFAGIDAVPIVLDVHKPKEIIEAIKAIAPSFGAINLEDIAAPQCFEVEDKLKASLSIPVMHDDQHGTAVVVLAGLINAAKITGRQLPTSRITIVGSGAAGAAVAKLLIKYAKPEIIMVDSQGIISRGRSGLSPQKQELAALTNPDNLKGGLAEAVVDSDIFIGVSQSGLLKPAMIKTMCSRPIIFAMANPVPEIMPDIAKAAGAAVVATGRSDLPNQVNNALAFPGIFRGALDHKVHTITDQHKIAAAEAIARLIKRPSPDKIIPTVFDKRLVPAIARTIK